MPQALAIETSGRIGSIALIDGSDVFAEEQFPYGLQHAAQIVPIIDRLTRSRGWGAGDLQELYVSAGPGSFTGLRIGITLAKTLALATRVRLVAVPTVRVLAENAPPEARHVLIVLDAKRDQIFTARFQRSGDEWQECAPAQLSSLTQMLSESPRPLHLIGEGIPYHEKFIPRDDPQVIVTPPSLWRARASAVAQLGLIMSARGAFTDPTALTPIYIRRPEAEEKLSGERQGTR